RGPGSMTHAGSRPTTQLLVPSSVSDPGLSARTRTISCPATGSTVGLSEIGHHVLDDRVVLERVDAQVLAVAGLLEAAVRHLRDERDVVVDPHAAEAQRARDAQRAPDVARPDRRREPVARAVGPCDRLLLVGEALHGDHRAEDLALDHLVVLLEPRDDRRLQIEPRPV